MRFQLEGDKDLRTTYVIYNLSMLVRVMTSLLPNEKIKIENP